MTQPTPTAAPPALLNITLGVMLALMLGWFFHIASGVLVPMVLGLMIVRRRMIWNRRPEFGLEGSGSVG